MRHLVARSQRAIHLWRLWSEVTASLPDVTLIGEGDPLPPDTFVIHCPTVHGDVVLAERDLTDYPGWAIVCGVSRFDEEITIAPGDRALIDGLWTRHGATGMCFGTIGCAAERLQEQGEPVPA